MDFRPAVPDMDGDFKGLRDTGGPHCIHAVDESAGQVGRRFSRLPCVRIGVIAASRFHIVPAVIGPDSHNMTSVIQA